MATDTTSSKTTAPKQPAPEAPAPKQPLPQAQSAKVREMQLLNEQAARAAKRRLAPDVTTGDTSVYDADKTIEKFYKDKGVIPADGYLYIGSPKHRVERMVSQGYRRLFDPETGDPVNTEHGDPCYWREKALQEGHIKQGVEKDRERIAAMDKNAGNRKRVGPQAPDDHRIETMDQQSETVAGMSPSDAERYVSNG